MTQNLTHNCRPNFWSQSQNKNENFATRRWKLFADTEYTVPKNGFVKYPIALKLQKTYFCLWAWQGYQNIRGLAKA